MLHHHHIASGYITEGMQANITRRSQITAEQSDTATAGLSSIENQDLKGIEEDAKEDESEFEEEAIKLPQSTHSLLFTQPVCSLPFAFAFGIVALSYTCLILALLDVNEVSAFDGGFSVPYNVSTTVRIAQYLALVIALLMEEEIPSALYLLGMVPKKSLHNKFPRMKFSKFVMSAVLRLISGYLFLINTFHVVASADAVLDIFYDVLALQFLQQLDDIAFNLAKIDVFGKRLKRACTCKCFMAEFDKVPFSLQKKKTIFLKSLYFLHLCLLLGGMVLVSVRQENGYYHCNSITVTLGDDIWEDSIVHKKEGIETSILMFSYFNGVYRRNGTADGRPVYVEQNKVDGSPYKETVGAEVRYCAQEGSWVFMHRDVSKDVYFDDSECPWLLKSPATNEYNLLDVTGEWSVWTGTVKNDGKFSAVCNECSDSTDCNFHGVCTDGECVCKVEDGYFGNHCEHKKPCENLKSEDSTTEWDLVMLDEDTIFRVYDRPVYRYSGGGNETILSGIGYEPSDTFALLYSGSRWFASVLKPAGRTTQQSRLHYAEEFHSFWQNAYTNLTYFVSDPSTESSPIAVDFFRIGRRGEQFGPFGELHPMRLPAGSGFFYCEDGNATSFF